MKKLSLKEFVVARQAPAAPETTPTAAQDSSAPGQKIPNNKKKDKQENGKTLTGQPRNQIDLQPRLDTTWTGAPTVPTGGMYIREAVKEKHVVLTFGRMNPPHSGHQLVVDKVKSEAEKVGGEPHVYLSKSQDKKKNPLSYDVKHGFAKKAFGDVVKHTPPSGSHIVGLLSHLHKQGYKHATIVAGEDRLKEYHRITSNYNGPGKDFNFKSIKVVSAGQRDPDAEDSVEGVSASKMRQHAVAGNHSYFKKNLPKGLQADHKEVMQAVKHGLSEQLSEEDLLEVQNVTQRIRKAASLRRQRGKVRMGFKRAMRRKAARPALTKRARRMAIKFMKQRILRGKKYSDLSYSARMAVDNRLKLKAKTVSRLAKRILPKLTAAEQQRKVGKGFARIPGLGKTIGAVREDVQLVLTSFDTIASERQLSASTVAVLEKKSEKSQIPYEILETIYKRGLVDWEMGSNRNNNMLPQQWAFNRVNSYINEGLTYYTADVDQTKRLMEEYGAGFEGTPELVQKLKHDTPGYPENKLQGFKNYKPKNPIKD